MHSPIESAWAVLEIPSLELSGLAPCFSLDQRERLNNSGVDVLSSSVGWTGLGWFFGFEGKLLFALMELTQA